MLGSIYTGLSGLISFSKGLDVISDNVANMNTPGFKSEVIQFQDTFYKYLFAGLNNGSIQSSQIGSGVKAGSTSVVFTQGELRETGNDTDVAINGSGYFVLRDDGNIFYTRAGRFDFDNEGFLISAINGMRVASLTGTNTLSNISIKNVRSSPPKATSLITFTDNLSTGSTTHDVEKITVFDSTGEVHDLKITLTKSEELSFAWLLEVFDENGNSISTGEIRYNPNGSPAEGFNTHEFTFSPSENISSTITLDFGQPDSFTGSTSFSGGTTSTLKTIDIDGHGLGSIISITFDEDGFMNIEYSNEQSIKHNRLALAHFENQQQLKKLGNALFDDLTGQAASYAFAGTGPMGTVTGGAIEISNVELTQQFTDLVIVQRGFQASSQVLSVANEMIQELINASGNR